MYLRRYPAVDKDRATNRVVKDKAVDAVADAAIAALVAEVKFVVHKAVNPQPVITKMATLNFISPNIQSN